MDDSREIREQIECLLCDNDFKTLERDLYRANQNVFEILGLSWDERSHSRVLTWLLTPDGSHGIGATFLSRFLASASKKARESLSVSFEDENQFFDPLLAESSSFSDVTVEPEYTLPNWRRPDIVLRSDKDNWLCIIENKVGANEGKDQTADYYSDSKLDRLGKYKSRLFVYLSPHGIRPGCPFFVPISINDVISILRGICSDERMNALGLLVIDQYIKCLEGNVMNQDTFHIQCRDIYRKHREAIDKLKDYGTTSLLASKVREKALEILRSNRLPGIASEWNWSSGRAWIALWPEKWPTKKNAYHAYYCIWSVDDPKVFDKIKIDIRFDTEDGMKVKELIKIDGNVPLDEHYILARDRSELDRAVVEGSEKIVSIIKASFNSLQEKLKTIVS